MSEKSLHHSAAAHASWARTEDRSVRVAPAHEGRDIAIAVKFGIVPEGTTVAGFQILLQRPEIAKRFQSARKAYYADLARRSVAARRKAKKAVDEAEAAEAELGEAV